MKQLKILVCLVFAVAFGGVELLKTDRVHGRSTAVALAAPTGVEASDDQYNSKVEIRWDAIQGANLYRVFRGPTSDAAAAVDIGTTQAASFLDTTPTPGQVFFYWVRAENGPTVSELSTADQGERSATQQRGPVPPLGPPPAPPADPVTAAKAFLGKTLFWDEQMSSTRTVACGTCHHSGNGGTDPRSSSAGIASLNAGPDGLLSTPDDIRGSEGVPFNNADGTYVSTDPFGLAPQVGTRKAVSYVNAAYAPLLFWDGRASNVFTDPLTSAVVVANGGALESQVAGPPVNTAEMAHTGRSWSDVASRIGASRPLVLSPSIPPSLSAWIGGRSYPDLFAEVFGTSDVTPTRIAEAIATFERTLYSDRAPVDLDAAGIAPLSPQEQRGRGVFNASNCNVCHAGSLFSDNSFRYIGVRPPAEDPGRSAVTGDPNDLGTFRVPSLRNVELRGSYFHNGQFTTLEQVVAFYNRGGDFNAPNKPRNLIRPLGLSPQQQADLVAFLKRPLTDPRVAAESAPFDRPTLYSESSRVPAVSGTGRPGSGSVTPQIQAISPPLVGNPNFTLSLSGGKGNADAVLVIDGTDPGLGTAVPSSGSLARIETTTQGTGDGTGWASVSVAIPDSSAVAGKTYFARWYVQDAGAANGFSVTPVAKFTTFGAASVAFALSGRVTTPDGRGLRNAVVTLVDSSGVTRRVNTSSLGFYQFDGLTGSGIYTVSVNSKQYRFLAKTVSLSGDLSDLDFVGVE